MPIQERNKLKSWFETGDYPTQQQFWDLIDSFIHKQEDPIDIDTINGLRSLLNNKADYEALQSHLANNSNPHQVSKEQIGLGNIPNAISSAITENKTDVLATSAAVYQLAQLIKYSTVERFSYSANDTFELPASLLLEKIVVEPNANITFSLGNTPGGKEIMDDITLVGGIGNVIQLDLFASGGNKTIYLNGITSPTTIWYYKR